MKETVERIAEVRETNKDTLLLSQLTLQRAFSLHSFTHAGTWNSGNRGM